MAQLPARDQWKLREQDLAQNTVEFPRRFPLIIEPQNRGSSVNYDARLVNCYVERDKKNDEYHIYGRPGILTSVTKSGNGGGVYNWLGNIYSIFGAKIYKDGVDMGATLDTTGGRYRFEQSLNPVQLGFGNGVKAYYTDGAAVTLINDVDFPTAFVKGWGYLDATMYVGVNTTAGLHGSDLNSLSAWDPLNKIIAQIESDRLIAVSKQLVYVIALKEWSTEPFYDAGNATASPLGRVAGAKISYGCIAAESVCDVGAAILWAGCYKKPSQSAGTPCVVMMDALKARIVSTPAVERLLESATFSTCWAWSITINGHSFYVLTLKTDNLTLVYDTEEDMWSQWTDADGNYFPIVSATPGTGNQTHLLQHETNGKLYLCAPSYVNDDGSLITCDIYTPNFDGGVRRRKMLDRLEFVGDQVPGSIIQVRCNDKDYDPRSWTNFRQVNMAEVRPYLDNCGTFYRRAYHFRHKCNAKMRIQGPEMQMGIGVL